MSYDTWKLQTPDSFFEEDTEEIDACDTCGEPVLVSEMKTLFVDKCLTLWLCKSCLKIHKSN